MKKKLFLLSFLVLFYLATGCLYSGKTFLANITTAIPYMPVGNSLLHMRAGDHFEQFYRYTLVKSNIEHGHNLYHSGYQYNIEEEKFTEGLVFFPFSFLTSMLAFVTGDILAYNIMLLLSYVFSGLAIFFLLFTITGHRVSSFIASVFFTLLPFRTSFLYGEMVYGMEMCLLPLPILFFEKFFQSKKIIYVALSGFLFFFLLTANMQLFYFYSLFTFPYFIIRSYHFFSDRNIAIKFKLISISVFIVSLIPVISYIFYIKYFLLDTSGLATGQTWSELLIYSPEFYNMFNKFNGNEKNIYIGLTIILMFCTTIYYGLKNLFNIASELEQKIILIFMPCFIMSYTLCFGPNLDRYLHFDIYKLFFDYMPFWNSSRTPGRIMGVSGFLYTILLGIWLHSVFSICNFGSKKKGLKLSAVVLITFLIIFDFKYTNASMVTLEDNNAYENHRNMKQNIIAIPFTMAPDHYFNCTYLYFAQKYNLRFYNGHSSIYPANMPDTNHLLHRLNEGELTKNIWEWLIKNNYRLLSVHNTVYFPKVNRFVLAKLMLNPNLTYLEEDKGVFLFEINQQFSRCNTPKPEKIYDKLRHMIIPKRSYNKVGYFSGWYSREVPPKQLPFRWMNGKHSSVFYLKGKNEAVTISFSYKNPLDDLNLFINEKPIDFESTTDQYGWKHVSIYLENFSEEYLFIEFETDKIYTIKSDSRKFGCMITDIQMVSNKVPTD